MEQAGAYASLEMGIPKGNPELSHSIKSMKPKLKLTAIPNTKFASGGEATQEAYHRWRSEFQAGGSIRARVLHEKIGNWNRTYPRDRAGWGSSQQQNGENERRTWRQKARDENQRQTRHHFFALPTPLRSLSPMQQLFLEEPDSPLLVGTEICHIYRRPHEASKGGTASEVAALAVDGDNNWLIQNASKIRASEGNPQ